MFVTFLEVMGDTKVYLPPSDLLQPWSCDFVVKRKYKKMSTKNIPRKETIFFIVMPPVLGITFLLIQYSDLMTILNRSPLTSIPRFVSFIAGMAILTIGKYFLEKWGGGTKMMDFSYPLSSYIDCFRFAGLTSFMAFYLILGFMLIRPLLDLLFISIIKLFL